ncbi:CBS domain-containing protein [Histidinibacterium aquaticum]|uniref:CBS domain-containing protein n=2 Tax=Histidinibacterium aquaticum TaxID=2613962 RepID=A0A5J5GD07_9RHOB|nr:CBS domain-containing protein [Histidinibacterium aquaticum]KAA9006079.1 CBS domain-containing protein [Histidinibacterium aquaticum]
MAQTAEQRAGSRLMDRPEYASKPKPLTRGPDATVSEAVAAMTDRSYGCVVVVDGDDKVIGIVTERDIMNKLVGKGLDPTSTKLSEIMTTDPRLARETDEMLDWLRMMSNERFRRLPVVDENGRIKAVFTQGDFVSYTWPDLMAQMRNIARAQLSSNFHYVLIGGGILIYVLAMIVVLAGN